MYNANKKLIEISSFYNFFLYILLSTKRIFLYARTSFQFRFKTESDLLLFKNLFSIFCLDIFYDKTQHINFKSECNYLKKKKTLNDIINLRSLRDHRYSHPACTHHKSSTYQSLGQYIKQSHVHLTIG